MPRFVWASLAAASIARALATTRAATLALLCDLTQYKPALGLTAAVEQDLLVVSWNGQTGAELRARYAIDGGQPAIRAGRVALRTEPAPPFELADVLARMTLRARKQDSRTLGFGPFALDGLGNARFQKPKA